MTTDVSLLLLFGLISVLDGKHIGKAEGHRKDRIKKLFSPSTRNSRYHENKNRVNSPASDYAQAHIPSLKTLEEQNNFLYQEELKKLHKLFEKRQASLKKNFDENKFYYKMIARERCARVSKCRERMLALNMMRNGNTEYVDEDDASGAQNELKEVANIRNLVKTSF